MTLQSKTQEVLERIIVTYGILTNADWQPELLLSPDGTKALDLPRFIQAAYALHQGFIQQGTLPQREQYKSSLLTLPPLLIIENSREIPSGNMPEPSPAIKGTITGNPPVTEATHLSAITVPTTELKHLSEVLQTLQTTVDIAEIPSGNRPELLHEHSPAITKPPPAHSGDITQEQAPTAQGTTTGTQPGTEATHLAPITLIEALQNLVDQLQLQNHLLQESISRQHLHEKLQRQKQQLQELSHELRLQEAYEHEEDSGSDCPEVLPQTSRATSSYYDIEQGGGGKRRKLKHGKGNKPQSQSGKKHAKRG